MTEVREFAEAWYRKLDVHEPLANYRPLLADKDLKMIFPEVTVERFSGFADWYDKVINLFFDEAHTVKEVKLVSQTDTDATCQIVVTWEASLWNAPEPTSQRIVLDAYQTWKVRRSEETLKPLIVTYIVDELVYAKGSARL
ncbi:MAG: hypothetical protein F6K31_35590 [Symploca sp. SIO2G7]|nr:hypothetical protein [Symploca sp. SIO2G7]